MGNWGRNMASETMSNEKHQQSDGVDETNLSLLDRTQAYLRLVLAAQVPDSLLVAAWAEFYRIYNELIRRYVLSRNIPSMEVDDCLQEVWVAVAKHLVHFEHPRERPGLRAWLYQLVRSKATDVIRQRARDPLAQAQSGAAPDHIAADESSLSVWNKLLVDTLLDDIALTESKLTCKIFRMRLFEGRKTAEIAAELKISQEVVRYRYNSLVRKLRHRMAVYTGDTFSPQEGMPKLK